MKSLSALLQHLQRQDPALPLVFETPDGEISPGYHVTELRHLSAKGIDCGGNTDAWQEARLQLLDGQGTTYMDVGKFISIVARSLSVMPELAHVSLKVEFGHDNSDLRLMSLEAPEHQDNRIVIALGSLRAVCKPAEKAKRGKGDQAPCCASEGASAERSLCCPTTKPREAAGVCCA